MKVEKQIVPVPLPRVVIQLTEDEAYKLLYVLENGMRNEVTLELIKLLKKARQD